MGQMPEAKVLANHIYEYKKGVRHMVLFTCNRRFEQQACARLCSQSIDYMVQPAGRTNVNVYFGRRECLDAIRLIITRPLNELTPEEDFILVPCWVTTYVPSANVTANVVKRKRSRLVKFS